MNLQEKDLHLARICSSVYRKVMFYAGALVQTGVF